MIEKNIKDFWDNKEFYKEKGIDHFKAKAREYYSEEFMNKYSKWSDDLKELNIVIRTYLLKQNLSEQYIEAMTYDWFCTTINNHIEEWITVNKDITRNDITIITEKLIADYIAICLTKFSKNAFTISTLLDSIKKVVIINNVKQ